ncbi:MAG: PQQ-binding-like beta-propeller repeat protein [Verrucomicrobia bacterium]|nr:PQQ-binding-like beta-propeller repeat protein [Verrucomicrobiota bacterium]
MRSWGKYGWLLFIGAWSITAAIAATPRPKTLADEILASSGVKAGLCVHLGCGSHQNPALIANLAAASRLLVHGLALDDASLARARGVIDARGLSGRAMIEKVALPPLPHLNDLANLVVITDWEALAAQGLTMAEVERVTAPGGVICIVKDGRLTKTVKARPAGMDDWPQPAHGGDGNRVSRDKIVKFPVGLRWQDGVPLNFNMWAACRGWVIAGGRCFTLGTTEPENLGPASFSKHRMEQYLTARDAFNGLPLWKVNCETTDDGRALNAFNPAALVTDGKRVYAFKKDKLVAFDAANGKAALSCDVKFPTVRLLLANGVLVASGWEKKELLTGFARGTIWAPWVPKTGAGAVEAFDAASGAAKWSLTSPAQEMVAADGVVCLLQQSGNPPTEQHLVGMDLQTGRERWRVAHTKFEPQSPLNLGCAGCGIVTVLRPKAKTLSVLSLADGSVLWEIKETERFWTPLVNGELWHAGRRYDPKSGGEKGKLPASFDSPMCTPACVVGGGDYVTASRGCSYIDLSASADSTAPQGGTKINWAGARGACIEGATPAHGMFYTGQNWCRCAPGQVPGFVAFGPTGDPPTAGDFEKARPIEKGPAFGKIQNPRSEIRNPDDWPMLRHDAQRSGAGRMNVADKFVLAWQHYASRPAEGPLAGAWNARLTSCLTAPVVSDGIAIAAATDAGQIVALCAATGHERWRFNAGSRVDTPPTLHRGLCLFGAHDGWLYALRASDGALAWRARLAPAERRMVAFGAVESVWPAAGSVLVHDGAVFASAGRTTESDGGLAVCAFEPAGGKQLWAKEVGPGPVRQNDLLSLRDGRIALHHLRFDAKTGACSAAGKGGREGSLEGLIDGTWTRLGTRRSGGHKIGRASAELFAWNDKTLFGYESKSRTVFALAHEKTAGDEKEKLKGEDYAWRTVMPDGQQIEAMALADNGLVVAGRVCDAKTGAISGFLWRVSLEGGKQLAGYPLELPPTYDGLALAGGRVYVSLQDGKVLCFGKAD